MLRSALIFIWLASAGHPHFFWPIEISAIDDEMRMVPISDLPQEAARGVMEQDVAGVTPALYIDLNGDGRKEIVMNDGSGGSGGPGYRIFQRENEQWNQIAAFQGGITLCEKRNGYYQLEVRSRGDGGRTGRGLFRFIDGQYRAVRSEAYKDGIFVRALNADELKRLSVR